METKAWYYVSIWSKCHLHFSFKTMLRSRTIWILLGYRKWHVWCSGAKVIATIRAYDAHHDRTAYPQWNFSKLLWWGSLCDEIFWTMTTTWLSIRVSIFFTRKRAIFLFSIVETSNQAWYKRKHITWCYRKRWPITAEQKVTYQVGTCSSRIGIRWTTSNTRQPARGEPLGCVLSR